MTEENSRLGTWVPVRIDTPPNDRDADAYIPPPLPLAPPLNLTSLFPLLKRTSEALGEFNMLRGAGCGPQMDLLLRSYISREAILSSQIEGTKTSLQDLLAPEDNRDDATPVQPEEGFATRRDDFLETINYVIALEYGLKQIRSSGGLPLGLQLLCEIHELLFRGSTRGETKAPGEFRRVQNYIPGNGFAAYIPPPPERLQACLDNFEKQLNDTESSLPLLVQAAILHAQFESIHPFLDGNGQVGRLLTILFLCQREILQETSLYLSLYFKKHREKYFSSLNRINAPGGWEAWIEFFLECVRVTAVDARIRAEKIQKMLDRDRKHIMASANTTKTTLAVYEILAQGRIVWVASVARELNCTTPPVYRALRILEEMNIVREITGKKRNRMFVYRECIQLITEDTEPFPF